MSSGADKIVSNIMSDAQAKADVNKSEAQVKVDAILADGEKRAEATKVKIFRRVKLKGIFTCNRKFLFEIQYSAL